MKGRLTIMKLIGDVLKKQQVNTKRQIEVDVTRGLAVFFMILVHVTGDLSNNDTSNSLFGNIIDFFGTIPAAPIFMFVMGIGFVYSKNQSPNILFKRGLLIFFGGYVLNLLRGAIPLYIGSLLGYYTLDSLETPWYIYLIEGDILQFAGLAMMFVSILRKVKLNEFYYPIVALIVSLLTPLVSNFSTGIQGIDIFIMTIFGKDGYVFHPLFSWIVYPLMGAFFGWLLIRTPNKNKFYQKSVAISIVGGVVPLMYCIFNPKYDLGIVFGDINKYFQHGIISNVLFLSFVVIWLAIWYKVSTYIPNILTNRILFWSKSVTVIYVVHWLIIGWLEFVFLEELSMISTLIAMVIITFFTDRLSLTYLRMKERFKERNDPELNPHLF